MIEGIRIVLVRDIRTYFLNFYGIGFRTFYLFLETVIFAYVVSKAVSSTLIGGLSYLQFFALGALVTSIFGSSYYVGRDVYKDRESGYLNYMMSLPIRRSEIIIARSLSGATRAVFNVIPLYCLALLLVPTSLPNAVASLALLFTFAVGVSGIAITVGLSVREEVKERLVGTLISLVLLRASTVMYPITAMPGWLQVGTKVDPVTYVSDSVRLLTLSQINEAMPLEEISAVLLFTALAGFLGSWLFSRVIEGGAAE